MAKGIKGYHTIKRIICIILSVLFLLSGCGKENGGTERITTTAQAGGVTTEEASAGSVRAADLRIGNMSFTLSDIWVGDGTEKGTAMEFDIDDSMLIITVLKDEGDVTDPDIKKWYMESMEANYDTKMSLLEFDSAGGRPAFGMTGDIRMSDTDYTLFYYIIRSDDNGYYIQFFQKDGEDHHTELQDFLDSIKFEAGSAEQPGSTEGTTEQVSGFRAGFKETLDAYETYFDKYAEYMVRFQDPDDTSAQAEYVEFINSYTDSLQRFQEIDLETLSQEEKDYYLQVMGRVSEKLRDIPSTP